MEKKQGDVLKMSDDIDRYYESIRPRQTTMYYPVYY